MCGVCWEGTVATTLLRNVFHNLATALLLKLTQENVKLVGREGTVATTVSTCSSAFLAEVALLYGKWVRCAGKELLLSPSLEMRLSLATTLLTDRGLRKELGSSFW